MYLGFTSPEHLTDLWEESHRNEPGETRAAELWRTLHSGEVTKVGETIEALARKLWDLHEKGSRIATYAVAQGKLSGTFLPADPEEGERLLHTLCDEGFPAAFAQLLKDVTVENPEQRTPCSAEILELIARGTELGLDRALVLQSQAWIKGWVVLEPAEARELAIRLLNAARNGCWESPAHAFAALRERSARRHARGISEVSPGCRLQPGLTGRRPCMSLAPNTSRPRCCP